MGWAVSNGSFPVYSATKAGVISFTRSLTSLAADSGIRVNAICPELVDTPLGVVMGQKVMAVEEMSALRASQSVLTPADRLSHALYRTGGRTRRTGGGRVGPTPPECST